MEQVVGGVIGRVANDSRCYVHLGYSHCAYSLTFPPSPFPVILDSFLCPFPSIPPCHFLLHICCFPPQSFPIVHLDTSPLLSSSFPELLLLTYFPFPQILPFCWTVQIMPNSVAFKKCCFLPLEKSKVKLWPLIFWRIQALFRLTYMFTRPWCFDRLRLRLNAIETNFGKNWKLVDCVIYFLPKVVIYHRQFRKFPNRK